MTKKLGRYDIVGKTIEEFLPYRDGAEIRLNNGKSLDVSLSIDDFKEPKHPNLINKIYEESDKAKGITTNKIKELMNELVGKKFKFNKKPCIVWGIKDYDLEEIEIAYDGKKKTINMYSLE